MEAIEHTTEILLTLFVMLAGAKLLAEIFERWQQPAVVGEILAGILIGPSLLGWVEPNEITNILAEIGVIFLLFTVGLETKPSALLRVGRRALLVAVLGIVLPFLGGWLLMQLWGASSSEALFIGTALVATSIGITARVLRTLGLLDAPTSRIILGAAVIDDVLGLLVLTVVANSTVGEINYGQITLTTVLAVAFTAFALLVAAPLLTRSASRIERLRLSEPFFVVGLIICLGLAVAAAEIGIAAIIGAFLAGMALAEATEHNHNMHRQTNGVTEFLTPFFLVNIGMQLQLAVFTDPRVIGLALLLTLIAILTKLFGCGLGVLNLGWRRAAQVGMGMVPRGEVGIVVAQLGLGLGVIDNALFGVVLFMAVVTTLIAPPLLKVLFANEPAAQAEIGPADAGDILVEENMARLG